MARASRPTLSLVHRLRPPARSSPDGRPPLLILLHGVGSNELSMAGLAPSFDSRFAVMSVRSPLEFGPFSFGWFHVTFTPTGPVIDGDEAEGAWTRMAAFVDEALEAVGADPDRVFVAGFSQGGIIALATLLTSPEKVAGAVCMSGRLPPEVEARIVDRERLRGKPLLIVHGRADATVEVALGRRAAAVLGRLPLALEYREDDSGHVVSPGHFAAVSAWLTDQLDRTTTRS